MSTKITILPNGSARVEGEFTIVDSEGKEFGLAGRTTVSLCRCGLSKNKPFCDGTHKVDFDADTKAFDLPPKKV
ncbi:MAG: CDGSH iron-sulfur domain-containing protein [Saprospiraceae bacterium]